MQSIICTKTPCWLGLLLQLLAVALITLFPSITMQAQESYYHLSVDNGLASTVVHDLLVDSKGYLWIATEAGVNRYDGKNIRHFTTGDGLGGNEVLKMAQDSQGRIWFLTFNGNVSYYLNNTFFNETNTNWLAELTLSATSTAFFEDLNGDIWIGSEAGDIYQISGETVTKHNIRAGNIRQIWRDGAYLYFGLFSGVYRWKPGQTSWTEVDTVNFWSLKSFKLEDGSVMIPTRDGLIYTNGNPLLRYTNQDLGLSSDTHTVSISPSNTYLVVGSIGDGIRFYVNDGSDQPTLALHWLQGVTISSQIYDNEGSLWIATLNQGIYRIDSGFKEYRYINETNLLNYPVIRSSLITSDGTIWFGGRDGTLYRFSESGDLLFQSSLHLGDAFNASVEGLYETDDQKLILGAVGGVYKLDYYNQARIDRLNGSNLLERLRYDEVLTTTYSVKALVKKGSTYYYGTNSSLTRSNIETKKDSVLMKKRITDLEFDAKDRLWIGTISGLWVYENDSLRAFDHQFVNNAQIFDLKMLHGTWLGVSTYGSGLILICTDTKTVRRISTEDGITSDLVKSTDFDEHGFLWIGTNNGITKIKFDTTIALSEQPIQLPMLTYTLSDGLHIDQISRVDVSGGRVWVSGNRGIVTFRADFVPYESHNIPLVVEEVIINGEKRSIDSTSYSVGYGQNQWDISFAGIFLRDGNRVKYRYRILEFDSEWTLNETGQLSFRYLDSGSYTLEIEAYSQDNRLRSEPLLMQITVIPPYWRTTWFLVLLLVATIIVLYQFVRWRIQFVLDKQKEKQEVSIRVIELEHQALMAMMKPHTIFNQISALRLHLFNGDPEKASSMILTFTKLLRLQLDASFKKVNSLHDEIERIRLQMDLDSEKLEQGIQFEFICESEIDPKKCMVPSLILQPFIENTIIHGLLNKREHGFILVWAIERGGQLVITIDDNGVGLREPREFKVDSDTPPHLISQNIPSKRVDQFNAVSPSIGLQLFIDRIRLIASENGLPWSVQFQNKLDNGGVVTGVRVELLLPVLLSRDLVNQ
jgi:ligand-binding sensor domain-containing protein